MHTRSIKLGILALLVAFLTLGARADQSVSGVISSLQSQYSVEEATFREALDQLPDNPKSLEDGSLSSKLLSISTDLQDLSRQAAQARQILQEKKRNLPTGLSQSDLAELNSALTAQQKPLDELDSGISALRSRIDNITSRQLGLWLQAYTSYADIEGEDAARVKLRNLIKSDGGNGPAKKKNRQ